MSDWSEDLLIDNDRLTWDLGRAQTEIRVLEERVTQLQTLLSYKALLGQMDRAFREQGRKDPATLLAIDEQVQGDPRLSVDDILLLHHEVQARLPSMLGWSR